MDCAGCGRANRAGARFCGGCGRPLAPRCPACASECEPGALFCDACGAPLAARAPAASEARKVVTIVFADLIGSTALHERLDPESTRAFMERYYQAMRGAVEAQGGRVTQLLGDGVKAVFGVPRVAEDDAIRAVRAAVGMQRAFRALADSQREALGRLGLRVAVNTGEVVADAESEIIGDPVNVAAHLQQQARDGDVLVGESTQRLVSQQLTLERVGTFALKGRAEPVTAWRVASLERPAGAPASAFVGRDEELRRIHAVYEAAVAGRRARLAVILGSPGLGKSRLLAEQAHRLGDRATLLTARCDATGGATFAPLTRALRAWLRVEEGARSEEELRAAALAQLSGDDAERGRIAGGIAALLGGAPAPPEETFFVVRRFLAALAATRPLVLAIDDLHWAEPLLLDLVEHLVQWSSGVPLFILAAARPELRDTRSSLAMPGGLVDDVVVLSGLDAGAATRLAANVIGADALPAAVAGRVLATSEGNPLFLGELVRMLVDDGVLVREGDRWVAAVELADLEMPPSIHALLAARIERLRPEERTLLERAAVIGRQFSRAAVAELLAPEQRGDLDRRLEALRRSELIESDTGWLLGEPVLRFHHVLIRDAAYRRLLKGTRAELHARFADWLEGRVGDSAEHDETLGWHLEQAHAHLRELGPVDARGRALGERAARHLAAAGRRALARDDLSLAAGLLGRALDRLDADAPARAELALDWCEALLAAGDVGPAAAAVAELGRFRDVSQRLRAWHTCFAGQLAGLTDPQALRATADAVAAAADALAAAGDAAGEAKAHSVQALALARLGKIGASEAALDRALAAARRVGDRRRQNAVLAGAPLAALWGPSPVTRASGRCLDVVRVLRITQGAPAVEAVALCCQGLLEALRGRADAARRMIATSRHLVEELGITQRLLEADVFAGQIELLEGDAAAAERCLRTACDGLRSQGLGIDAAQAAALLGRALLAQGRAAEAEALSHESEALAGDDLKAGIAWRGVRAEALARRGEHAAAVELARAAVEIAAATDALLDHADARLALAAALRAAGRGDAAAAEEARAIELWEAKGATLLAERARRGARPVAERGHAPEERALPAGSLLRRVQPNAATAAAAHFQSVAAGRDSNALASLLVDDFAVVHHPTGAVFGREGGLERFQLLWRTQSLASSYEPLATLGDLLMLGHDLTSFARLDESGLSFGASESSQFVVFEVDAGSRCSRAEVFASDHLGQAIARLYERYAELLPEGGERVRAAATARSVASWLQLTNSGGVAAVVAPAVEFVGHRPLGMGSARGAEVIRRASRAQQELASDIVFHIHDILALCPGGFLLRCTTSGVDRVSGGAYERPLLLLSVFGPEGLVTRIEWFAPERDAEALARFDALLAEPPAALFENAAGRAQTAFERRWRERDWEGVLACFAPGVALDDRRPLVGLFLSGEDFVANLRLLWQTVPSPETRLLATRGERLALHRARLRGELDGGPFEDEHLSLIERDTAGRAVAMCNFALADEAAAYAELDRRFAAGEGAAHAELLAALGEFRRAAPAVDRAALTRLLPDDFTYVNHRHFAGTGARMSRDEYVASLGVIDELGVHSQLRLEHLRIGASAGLGGFMWSGTREGGDFDMPLLFVFRHDGARLRSLELYDEGQHDAALARLEELSRTALRPAQIENAATRAEQRAVDAFAARDWERFAALFPPHFRSSDRRKLMRLELDRDQLLDAFRPNFEMSAERTSELLATRGDRLALLRVCLELEGSEGSVGPSEVEFVQVLEVDERGERLAAIAFDAEDLDAAYAELDARYLAGEGAPHAALCANLEEIQRAVPAADRAALTRLLPDDFTLVSHRHFAGTGVRMARDEYVTSLRVMDDLHVLSQLRLDHLRIGASAGFGVFMWRGTREGGDFDMPLLFVFRHDGRRLHSWELYDEDQLEAALARYAELSAEATASRRIETAATRGMDRMAAAWRARDWKRFAALFSADHRTVDRRKLMQSELTRDEMLEGFRSIFETAPRLDAQQQVIATRGDRLALIRERLTGEIGLSGTSEVEYLLIIGVDERGDLELGVAFDLDALDAAYAELELRYAAGEAASARRASLTREFSRAFAARDWEALAALLAPDLVVEDHRRLGWETLHGPEAYLQALRALVELAPDVRLRVDHVSMSDPGFLYFTTWQGTREGGAFEEPSIIVCELDAAGRIRRFDQYDLEQQAEARARLAAIGAGAARDPLRIPPNAASRASDRVHGAREALDWDAFGAACAPVLEFDDRRRSMLSSGDRDMFIANSRWIAAQGIRAARTLLATAGDRLALEHGHWTGANADVAAFEMDTLSVTEVDAEGRVVAVVIFDPDARRAASLEMFERYARSEAAHHMPATVIEGFRAMNAHDVEGLRALLPADFVFHDHRRTGLGRLEGAAAFIASLAPFFEQAPDLTFEALYTIASEQHGELAMARVFATLANGGGAVESVHLRLWLWRGDRIVGMELFEPADLERARARLRQN